MWSDLLHSFPNALDLVALTTCIGTLACRLWVIRPAPTGSSDMQPLLTSLWRLLLVCLVVLAPSSAVGLIQRAAEMSGRPLAEVASVLQTVLFNTHYGHAWLIRVGALAVLWMGWWLGRRNLHSLTPARFMLAGALILGITRSASGHGADAGDFTLPELMDWLHLLAASLWSGSLVTFATVVFPAWLRFGTQPDEPHAEQIAAVAQRFSILAGVALAVVLLTGLYNFWFEARAVSTLSTTSYGKILCVKLLFVLALIVLGASNRYFNVAPLQRLTNSPRSDNGPLKGFILRRYIPRAGVDASGIVRRFARTVTAEVILMVGVLVDELVTSRFARCGKLHLGHAIVARD